jgi:ribosomal protein S11
MRRSSVEKEWGRVEVESRCTKMTKDSMQLTSFEVRFEGLGESRREAVRELRTSREAVACGRLPAFSGGEV